MNGTLIWFMTSIPFLSNKSRWYLLEFRLEDQRTLPYVPIQKLTQSARVPRSQYSMTIPNAPVESSKESKYLIMFGWCCLFKRSASWKASFPGRRIIFAAAVIQFGLGGVLLTRNTSAKEPDPSFSWKWKVLVLLVSIVKNLEINSDKNVVSWRITKPRMRPQEENEWNNSWAELKKSRKAFLDFFNSAQLLI